MKVFAIFAVLAVAVPAFADQFSMGGGTGTVFFCTSGAGQPITVSTSDANCGTAGGTASSANSGTFESPTGNGIFFGQQWSFTLPTQIASLTGANFTTITNGVPSNMSIGGNNGTLAITGTITWTSVNDHTPKPQLIGTFHVSANPNTGILLSDYPVGANLSVDYTINLGTNPTLGTLWDGGATRTSGSLSSGEVVPTPETSSILLMGTGMLLAGTVVRLRRRKNAEA